MKNQTKNNISKHEAQYWHIPKFSILPLFLMLIFIGLSIVNFMFIVSEWKRLDLGILSCRIDNCKYSFNQLTILYPIFFEYIFISLVFISLTASIKKGFRNLKKYDEDGLIFGLILGLIGGLIGGLIVGLISGLIVGLISGLIGGLIVGLIVGLIEEFEK